MIVINIAIKFFILVSTTTRESVKFASTRYFQVWRRPFPASLEYTTLPDSLQLPSEDRIPS
jgi:hypothetical protein